MADERRRLSASERFHALLDEISPERLDEIDLNVRVRERLDEIDAREDPDHTPNELEWLLDLSDMVVGDNGPLDC